MLLEGRNAIVYGGGGSLGGAAARAFAREGARVYLAGRTRPRLDAVADAIRERGGTAEVDAVDALDERAVRAHADRVDADGGIHVALNAIGVPHVQGTPFLELPCGDYFHPIDSYLRSNFITAQAVARHMARRRAGVLLTISTPGARLSGPGFLGYGVTCAAVEGLSRILAGELGRYGVRVVCLRSDAIPESLATSHVRAVFEGVAARAGADVDSMLSARASGGTLLSRFPRLDEFADFAAFAASDRAGAMTGAIANLTCGSVVD